MRVAVVAEWYPSPADPVHGVWAHRQALAARDAGAEVRVLAMRRPVPPLALVREALRSPRALADWARRTPATMRPWTLDGLAIQPVPFLAPPRPLSYGSWGRWMAPTLGRALGRLEERFAFDVVHAHNVVPTGHGAARWRGPRERGGPALVVSAHGPDVIHVPERSAAAARATRQTLLAADLVMANSRWAERRCEELAGRALPARVVHLGADLPAGEPRRRERTTLVTVAHLQARKRHADVLHALAALAPDLELDYLVIGDGEERRALQRLSAELGLAGRVRFAGQLEPEGALAEARSCHLFAMPSVEEPFGVAYVEAMAAGVPAIGARGEGGPEDIAAAGGGMLLVPAGDRAALARTIATALSDRERLRELGTAARENVRRHFTWERCGRATVEAYEAALR